MRTEKLGVILIALTFMLVVVFSCVSIFSLKKVDAVFAVSENANVEEMQNKLDDYLGKNLLFFDTEQVYTLFEDNRYVEVLSVKKEFPNVLKVEIKERREVFYVALGDKGYATTDSGFVLGELSQAEMENEQPRDRILLEFDENIYVDVSVGEYLSVKNSNVADTFFEMVKSFNLTDCIKKVSVLGRAQLLGEYDVVVETYTGVKIEIENVENNGVNKIKNAFYVYDNFLSDYQKFYGELVSNNSLKPAEIGQPVLKVTHTYTKDGVRIDTGYWCFDLNGNPIDDID